MTTRRGAGGGVAPGFRILSLVAMAFGGLYAVLGAVRLAEGREQAGLLLGFGLLAAAVGAVVWRWARRAG
jgi:hypothetical protein